MNPLMEKPKLLLIGKNGQVGWELQRTLAALAEVVPVDFPEIDLTDGTAVRELMRGVNPRIIVNAAAYTAVDKAESEPDRCHRINAVAPALLAEDAKRIGALIIHYSTDYVFDGTKTSPYVEDDQPNPLGAYGRSKQAGDEAVRAAGADHLIFRLCWVYGTRGQNFLLTIQRLAREREQLRVVSDQVGCPTWSRLIAEATTLALSRVLADSDRASFSGTYHLAASGQTNWHEFASKIVATMPETERKCREVVPITTPEYPTPARRPAYSVLGCQKLERKFGLRLPDWHEGLLLAVQK